MENPRISIIVPVYNVEKYLPQCLDSILAQTCTDWECILVDDGSTDGGVRQNGWKRLSMNFLKESQAWMR